MGLDVEARVRPSTAIASPPRRRSPTTSARSGEALPHGAVRDPGLAELVALGAIAELRVELDHDRLCVQDDLRVPVVSRVRLECAHERAAGAGPTKRTAHRDALGLRVTVVGDAEPGRPHDVVVGERDEVDAHRVAAVHLLVVPDVLLIDEDLAAHGETPRELIGSGATHDDHAARVIARGRRP